jgi:hypothetical protein
MIGRKIHHPASSIQNPKSKTLPFTPDRAGRSPLRDIQRTVHPKPVGTHRDMEVYLRRRDVLVTEWLLKKTEGL